MCNLLLAPPEARSVTATGLVVVASFLALTVVGFLCYIVITAETDGDTRN